MQNLKTGDLFLHEYCQVYARRMYMDDTLNTLSFSLVPRLLCICTHKILIQAGALADASTFRVEECEFVC